MTELNTQRAIDEAIDFCDRWFRLTGEAIDPYTVMPDCVTALQKFEAMSEKWDRFVAKLGKSKPLRKFPKPKPIDPETEAYFENQRRDTAKMLGRHRRQCRLRTGREVG